MFRRSSSRSDTPWAPIARARRAFQSITRSLLHPLAWTLAKVVLALGLIVGLYALLGFVVAPRVLRGQLVELVRERYGRELAMGAVRVHPFKLSLEIESLALPDGDGSAMLRVGRLFVDVQGPASLWNRALVFRAIALERPAVDLVIRRGGALNLADLAPEKHAAQGDEELPRLWIQALTVRGGAVSFADRNRATAFERTVAPVTFSVRDFRTTAGGGRFGLSARTSEGAELAWRGQVALAPELASSGSLKVTGLPLASIGPYLAESLPFELPSGRLDLEGRYALRAKQVDLELRRVEVAGLGVRARTGGAAVDIARLTLHGAKLALHRSEAEAQSLVVEGLRTSAVRSADGTLNLAQLVASTPTFAPPSPSSAAPAPTTPHGTEWRARLGRLELRDAALDLQDRAPAGGARVEVASLSAVAERLSLELDRPISLTAQVALAPSGRVHVSGSVTPLPFAARLEVQADALPLALAQPYLREHTSLVVGDGRLALSGAVALLPGARTSKLHVRGDLTVQELRALEGSSRQDLLALKRLEVRGARYDSDPRSLQVEHVLLSRPSLRVILSGDQKLNVLEALTPATAPKDAPAAVLDGEEAPLGAGMAVDIKAVAVERMRVNFSDYFSQPHFAADIQNLAGTLRNLSTSTEAVATVALRGTVGENSPAQIDGKLRPFAFDSRSDLQLRFGNVPLPIFNPYSGRFAGYQIERGELTTNVSYRLRKGALEAHHRLRIDQLTWGEATDSKEKAPLPVKLATALLRDRQGVIDLDLPVQGSLNDPAFQVWPIVWQVLKNVVVKAATAPFDVLASLFAGADEARVIDFEPGDARLSPSAERALASLTKALAERPALHIDVPLDTIVEADRRALAESKFRARVQKLIRVEMRVKGDQVPALESLEASDKVDVLSALYHELTGNDPDLPEAPEAPEGSSWREARAHRRRYEADYLERATRAKLTVTEEELAALGRRRAEVIEASLLRSGEIETTRVLLATTGKGHQPEDKARVALGLR